MQGFVFSDPQVDSLVWRQVETGDLEDPAHHCTPAESEWLLGRAVEATLFQIYLLKRRSGMQTGQPINDQSRGIL
jgi:hypothetical protein